LACSEKFPLDLTLLTGPSTRKQLRDVAKRDGRIRRLPQIIRYCYQGLRNMNHRKSKPSARRTDLEGPAATRRVAHSLAEHLSQVQPSAAPEAAQGTGAALSGTLDSVTWLQACGMAKQEPNAIVDKWKAVAPDCDAVRPADIAVPFFDHARYTQLRHELTDEWQPQNQIERMFLDQLARTFTAYMHWHQIALDDRGTHLADVPFSNRRQRVDQARRMAESTYVHVLSTLKSMREIRP
jgi:hypothetical protein